MKIFFLSIIFLCFINFSFAQDVKKIDSLLKVLATTKHDTAKVWTMIDVSYNYLHSNTDKSAWYAQQALTLAKKTNDEFTILWCMTAIGNALVNTGSYAASLKIYLEVLERSEKLKNEELISSTFLNISTAYDSQGDYKQAISYSLRSLEINIAAKYTYGILINYMNLG